MAFAPVHFLAISLALESPIHIAPSLPSSRRPIINMHAFVLLDIPLQMSSDDIISTATRPHLMRRGSEDRDKSSLHVSFL